MDITVARRLHNDLLKLHALAGEINVVSNVLVTNGLLELNEAEEDNEDEACYCFLYRHNYYNQ